MLQFVPVCARVLRRNTLQHTATHNTVQRKRRYPMALGQCNIPQHMCTHRNTLQHTATHCNARYCIPWVWPCLPNALQCVALCCSVLQCVAALLGLASRISHVSRLLQGCNTLQYTAAHCTILQHTTTHIHTLQRTRASRASHIWTIYMRVT